MRIDPQTVEDVAKVNLFFLDHPEVSGTYNVGTGAAQSFNDVAAATVNACRKAKVVLALGYREQGMAAYARLTVPFTGG